MGNERDRLIADDRQQCENLENLFLESAFHPTSHEIGPARFLSYFTTDFHCLQRSLCT